MDCKSLAWISRSGGDAGVSFRWSHLPIDIRHQKNKGSRSALEWNFALLKG
jgi:hypothetical protein